MTKLAWATKAWTNGAVYQWSRWHIVYNTDAKTVTLCGIAVPEKTIWVHGGKDYRIKGGCCQVCAKCNSERYPQRLMGR